MENVEVGSLRRPKEYELKQHGEPSLREMARSYMDKANELRREAEEAREIAAIYLAAANRRAAEKQARKEQRRARSSKGVGDAS